jgi:signal transduction histidine kinase
MQRGEVLHSSPQQPSRITKALHKSGQPLYVDMSFAVVKDPSGQTTGSFAVAREATQRFQQDRATRRELTELRAAQEAKPG